MRAVRELANRYGIRVILDAARVVENAFFIQKREPGCQDRSIASIVKELCSYTDGCTMSAKKDPMVNIGGFLAVNDHGIYEDAANLAVIYEGLHTYGGMAGRDMEALATGIEESLHEDHIRARVGQVLYLGQKLIDAGIPIVQPIGGHGVFLDAREFLPHLPQEQYPAPGYGRWREESCRPGGTRRRARTTSRAWSWCGLRFLAGCTRKRIWMLWRSRLSRSSQNTRQFAD